ncbi:MAG: hypothetical protein OHK0046_36580 [Anaerolineae bacterium]
MQTRQFSILGLLLVMWAVLLIRVDASWFGEQEATRTWIPAAVRNYDVYGLQTTGLIPIRNTAPTTPENFDHYSHHPPMMVWLPAFTTRLFGFNEVGVRFGFIAVTLLTIAAFYVLVRRLYSVPVAFWAALFFAVIPMTAYLGRVPGQSLPALLVSVLFGAVLINWLKAPTRPRLLLLGVLAALAVWTAWVAVFFVGFMGLAAFWVGSRSQKVAVVGLGVLCVVMFFALMGFYQWQWAGAIESILDAFVYRTSNQSFQRGSEDFTLWDFFGRMGLHLVAFTTPGFMALALLGLLAFRKRSSRLSTAVFIGLLLGGLMYQLVFRNASYIHNYYKAFMTPAMAIAAGMAVVYLRDDRRFRRFSRPVIDGLILTTILLSVGVGYILHRTGEQPWLEAVIQTINAQATPEDTIMLQFLANRDGSSVNYTQPTEFYTFRRIAWDTTPEAARRMAETQPVFYIYCRDDVDKPGLEALLTVFPSHPYETVYPETCWLFQLQPTNPAT